MAENDANAGSKAKPPVRLRKPDRHQIIMAITCPDDWVDKDHEVRTIAAFVQTLDLSAFCEPIKAREGNAGRNATDPALLVSLWLYANIRGVGSARQLDRECRESRPFQWLCGGVGVNYHMLSDFRVDHAAALEGLFTATIASMVSKGLVEVMRISQDGIRIRAGAGASSFRREASLEQLLADAKQHVEELARELDDPEQAAAIGARRAAAAKRAAEDRADRLQQAIDQMPALKEKQAEAVKRAGNGKCGQKIAEREPRVSTTDPDARVMKMANGGFNPAFNIQMATDTESRAILAVDVSNEGSDSAGLSEPLRQQVEERTGQKVQQHLLDGGYMKTEDIEQAHAQGVEILMPPKTARTPGTRGKELEPKPGDTPAILDWKARMRSDDGKAAYKERASTSETANADLRCHRGLQQMAVRGIPKVRCVAVWCALAYNVMHFAKALMS
jgi:transposase